jgi:EGF-like domain
MNVCGDYVHSFCVATAEGYTCQCDDGYIGNPLHGQECTLTCDNPYGNPCGPDQICQDTDTGYSCPETKHTINRCPYLCSPTMHCAKETGYQCVCKPGYYQPEPYFPCRPMEG